MQNDTEQKPKKKKTFLLIASHNVKYVSLDYTSLVSIFHPTPVLDCLVVNIYIFFLFKFSQHCLERLSLHATYSNRQISIHYYFNLIILYSLAKPKKKKLYFINKNEFHPKCIFRHDVDDEEDWKKGEL